MSWSSCSENESLALSDGRKLSYGIYGSPASSQTVFLFHLFLSSRLEGRLWHRYASDLNARLIVPDRPGMGASTFQSGRTLLGWPCDVLALADHLGVTRFVVMGIRGSSSYVWACLHSIPATRLAGVIVMSGLYPNKVPTEAPSSTWPKLFSTPIIQGLFYLSFGRAARNPDPHVFEETVKRRTTNWREIEDACVKVPDDKAAVVEAMKEALRQGCKGSAWELDFSGDGTNWGFDLKAKEGVEIRLWHGDLDTVMPVDVVLRTAEVLGGVQVVLKYGEGGQQPMAQQSERHTPRCIGYA